MKMVYLKIKSRVMENAESDLWSGRDKKTSAMMPNYQATIPQDDIHRANQFHAHPYHHLLTCPDDDNQWFWGGHLAHMGCAESDLWLGHDKNQQ
jgi:hypothetical protein